MDFTCPDNDVPTTDPKSLSEGNSGDDVSKEVSAVAKTVHLCARAYTATSPSPPDSKFPNIVRCAWQLQTYTSAVLRHHLMLSFTS
eukprot:644597-Pelagomonas_calceolata.AAC.3